MARVFTHGSAQDEPAAEGPARATRPPVANEPIALRIGAAHRGTGKHASIYLTDEDVREIVNLAGTLGIASPAQRLDALAHEAARVFGVPESLLASLTTARPKMSVTEARRLVARHEAHAARLAEARQIVADTEAEETMRLAYRAAAAEAFEFPEWEVD